jgi:hypothetical protein
MIQIIKHGTNEILAEIARKALNKWCDANGYLPHHKTRTGWVVI